MLRVNVGLSRKLSKDYNSTGYSVNLDGELTAAVSDPEGVIEQVKELMALLPVVDPQTDITTFGPETGENLAGYDDLDDFDGANFSPPINADRITLNDYTTFSQQVTVENVNPTNFEQVVGDHTSYFVRVTVGVYQNSQLITSASWLRARY